LRRWPAGPNLNDEAPPHEFCVASKDFIARVDRPVILHIQDKAKDSPGKRKLQIAQRRDFQVGDQRLWTPQQSTRFGNWIVGPIAFNDEDLAKRASGCYVETDLALERHDSCNTVRRELGKAWEGEVLNHRAKIAKAMSNLYAL
jgi:hypothetical protein